jgi:glycerophosphoryl diester phosphodiesterase
MKKICLVLLALVAVYATLTLIPHRVVGETPWLTDRPLVIAHAGGKGIEPDNTMRSFRYAHSVGAVLEMDVQITQDEVLITRHGENRTGNLRDLTQCDAVSWELTYQYILEHCNAAYRYQVGNAFPYQAMTSEEWRVADVHVPTVEEILQTFGRDAYYVIEIKADADAPRTRPAMILGQMIRDYGLEDRVLVASFHDDIMATFAEFFPDLYLNASGGPAQTMVLHSYSFSTWLYRDPTYVAVSIPTSYGFPVINRIALDNRFVTRGLNRLGVAVHYWTINDPEEMRRLIRIGANGIITDYPELLQQIILEEFGE